MRIGFSARRVMLTMLMLAPSVVCGEAVARRYDYKLIKVPRAKDAVVVAMNSTGTVAGNFTDPDGGSRVFIYKNGRITKYIYPRSLGTYVHGMNDKGDFVGNYVDRGGLPHGFVYTSSAAQFTTLDFPGRSGTTATAINNSGDVVGNYVHSGEYGGTYYGFKYVDKKFVSLKNYIPVAINAKGDMAVNYISYSPVENLVYAYLLMANGQATSITDNDVQSSVYAINDKDAVSGNVAGYGSFVYRNGTPDYYGSPSCPYQTIFSAINEAGDVLGTCYDGEKFAGTFVNHQQVFDTLPMVRGMTIVPVAINNAGTVLGQLAGFAGVIATPR